MTRAPLGFNKSSCIQAWGITRAASGEQGGTEAAFVSGKNVPWCSFGTCTDFAFLLHLWPPQGRAVLADLYSVSVCPCGCRGTAGMLGTAGMPDAVKQLNVAWMLFGAGPSGDPPGSDWAGGIDPAPGCGSQCSVTPRCQQRPYRAVTRPTRLAAACTACRTGRKSFSCGEANVPWGGLPWGGPHPPRQ